VSMLKLNREKDSNPWRNVTERDVMRRNSKKMRRDVT
jgi:hypothetical protein